MGGHLLGADAAFLAAAPEAVTNVIGPGLATGDLMTETGKQGMLVPQLINLLEGTAPWLLALLSVCALAAMQSTGAAYMSTAGGMLTRDLIKHYLIPDAGHGAQKLYGRIGVAFIVLAALVVATVSSDALVLLGGPRRGLRLPDVAVADRGVLVAVADPRRGGVRTDRRPGRRHADREPRARTGSGSRRGAAGR